MAVRIQKSAVNIREKLAELERPIGVNGAALMKTETPQEAFSLIGAGSRNRIINGDMRIDQRNAGAANASTTYGIDRWGQEWSSTGVTLSFQQVSEAPAGYSNSLKVTVSTGSASFTNNAAVRQVIEGFNSADLAWGTSSAQSITVSFWVRSSLTGSFGGSITNGNFNRTYPFFYTISSANTWEYKTVTIPGDTTGTWATDNTAGVQLIFGLGAVSARKATAYVWANSIARQPTESVDLIATTGATWQITCVQLEKGKVATPFEYRSYGQELALCQRYYYKSSNHHHILIKNSFWESTTFYFPVTMRSSPSVSLIGTPGTLNLRALNASSDTANTPVYSTFTDGFFLTSNATNNDNFYSWILNGTLSISAEL